MSKKELIEVLHEKDDVINSLKKQIETLELRLITSQATVLDNDVSIIINSLKEKIQTLEGKTHG